MIEFKYKGTSGLSEEERAKKNEIMEKYRLHLQEVVKDGSMDFLESSINLPFDTTAYDEVESLLLKYKTANLKYIIVVGIGGSNLGTQAVYEALYSELYAHTKTFPKILFADTVDTKKLSDIISIIKNEVKNADEVVLNIISKSGSTTETIANFEVIYGGLKDVIKDFHKSIVATTGEGSKLWNIAKENNITTLSLPAKVGGRYSVLSTVGLFPLALAGVDVKKLLKGAQDMVHRCVDIVGDENPALCSASIVHVNMENGKVAYNSFFFSSRLKSIGAWWRQLVGESLGKQEDNDKVQVNTGILPIVSIGSTDLHSVAQLYFGGPKNIFTSIITVVDEVEDRVVPEEEFLGPLVKGIAGKTLSQIMNSIELGVKSAYINEKMPFVEVILPKINEEVIGAYLQFRMIETMYLAYAMNINAFDQPNVETYKKETKVFLEKTV